MSKQKLSGFGDLVKILGMEDPLKNEHVVEPLASKTEILVWCTNPGEKKKDHLKFASEAYQQLELNFDSFFFTNNKGRVELKYKEEDELLFENIAPTNFYYATLSDHQGNKQIDRLLPMVYRLPLDTRMLLENTKKEADNYSLWLNKAGTWNDDKFKLIDYSYQDGVKSKIACRPLLPNAQKKALTICMSMDKRQERQIELMGLAGAMITSKKNWRMVVGLGVESVYETGITLHPVYGFPYIPGSAVKGTLRSWIISEVFKSAAGDAEKRAYSSRLFCDIFGCEETEGGAYAGESRKGKCVFFDAFAASEIKIKPEVMTPHYGDYYTSEGKVPPADYLKPNPIIFLTVADTSFRFRIAVPEKFNHRLADYPEDELAKASLSGDSNRFGLKGDATLEKMIIQWLNDALMFSGIGAKTAVGYGRMSS